MSACDRLRADAAGLAALAADDPERAAAWEHAARCPACAGALREAERLQALVADLAPSPLPPRARSGVPRAIAAELRREARWRMVAAVAAVCVLFTLLVALARHRSPAGVDAAVAVALALSAAGLAAASRRFPGAAAGGAVLVALAAAGAAGRAGPVEAALGPECLLTEQGCAAAVVAAVWLVLRRGSSALTPRVVMAGAAAGALCGAAALQLTCPAHAALPHLLAFHTAGVLVAAGLAGAASRVVAHRNPGARAPPYG